MDAHESGQGIVTYISLIVRRSGQTKSQHLRESACAGEILREKSQHLSSTVLFADFFQISRVAHETDGTSKPLILLDSQDWPPLRSPCKISISHEIRCQARVFPTFSWTTRQIGVQTRDIETRLLRLPQGRCRHIGPRSHTNTGDGNSAPSVTSLGKEGGCAGMEKPRDSGACGADDGNRTRVISLED